MFLFNHVWERNILLIIVDIFVDFAGFEQDFAHELVVGMADGDSNKFGAGFVNFEKHSHVRPHKVQYTVPLLFMPRQIGLTLGRRVQIYL